MARRLQQQVLISFSLILIFFSNQHINVKASNSSFIDSLCDNADGFHDSCLKILSEITRSSGKQSTRSTILEQVLKDSTRRIKGTAKKLNFAGLRAAHGSNVRTSLEVNSGLMNQSLERITDAIKALRNGKISAEGLADAHTWLSTVVTNHLTCVDEVGSHGKGNLVKELDDLVLRARTALSVFVSAHFRSLVNGTHLFHMEKDFPSWVRSEDRKVLEASDKKLVADVVVAKDGSGKYSKVSDAVAAAPTKSDRRYVIYIKKGTYKETVRIKSSQTNIMLVGDGGSSTIITGSLNVVDGTSTFNSATVAAEGDGFIAQDIGFQNTAGPAKHQAVALRVGADRAVINRCQIDGYQDTLYAHSNRQFYRDTTVSGTVDFIFGNAAVVLQNCNLVSRKPMSGQKNTITAQGRTDRNQNTGTSIQNSNIIASNDLTSNFKSYLGRPWKKYSRTVVMESFIDNLIDPAGWLAWRGSYALDTLYYGEYQNSGPGAPTGNRVNWPGYHVITIPSVAAKFTVVQLIQGDQWLDSTGVNYKPGL